jgi:hypothetical protein
MCCILALFFATFVGDMLDLDRDTERERENDRIWIHGEKVGAGFKCKYCRETKSGGGGTRLKSISRIEGRMSKKYLSIPLDIKAYFQLHR